MAGFIFISWSHKYRNGFTKTNKATVPLDTIKPLLIVSTFTLISKLILMLQMESRVLGHIMTYSASGTTKVQPKKLIIQPKL